MCIVHEGYIRICSHDSGIVRLSQIAQMRPSLGFGTDLQCKDNIHRMVCAELSNPSHNARQHTEHASPTAYIDDTGTLVLQW